MKVAGIMDMLVLILSIYSSSNLHLSCSHTSSNTIEWVSESIIELSYKRINLIVKFSQNSIAGVCIIRSECMKGSLVHYVAIIRTC